MERLLSAAGINGFDPNSEVGQLIEDCRTLLNKAARADIPDVVVEQGIEEYIEAVTIRRALYKKLVELEAPREDDSDAQRGLRRRASRLLEHEPQHERGTQKVGHHHLPESDAQAE